MDNGEWRNGLFSHVCGGDCGTCMGAWCCGPCLYGRTSERLDHYSSEETPGVCNGPCWLMCGAGCCHLHWLVALFKRGDVRHRFGIKGDGCTDCLASYFCFPCTLAQMETEVKDRAKIANQSAGLNEGYAQPGGMVYQPPQQAYHQQPPMGQQEIGYAPAPHYQSPPPKY